jgi:fumarate reductase subunit C
MAHPQAMQPHTPGSTRTAPGQMPAKFPTGGRYLSYIAFGATSFFYLAISLLVLRVTWALGDGAQAWAAVQASFQNPIYLAFHAVTLVVFLWAAWRFLIKLSAKAQPKKVGPLRPPPAEVVPFAAAAGWVAATAVVIIVLWGIFP